MSDPQLMIVRELPVADRRWVNGATPAAPTGFTRPTTSAIGVFSGEQLVWAAAYGCTELRGFGRVIARAAILGSPRLVDPVAADGRSVDRCYRALLDHFFTGRRPTDVLVIELHDAEQHHVDVLWRLGLALNTRLIVSQTDEGVRLEFFGRGRRAEFAAAIGARPQGLVKSVVSGVGGLFRKRRRTNHHTLAVVIRDVREPAEPVVPGVPVQFAELAPEEVRQRAGKFGLGLVTADDGLEDRRQFVGRVDGRIVFQIAFHSSAPALHLLSSGVRAHLMEPVALLTEAHTEIGFRNNSIFAAGLQWLAEWAGKRGIRTLAMLILVDNVASLRGSAKAGFQRVGELTIAR